LSGSGSFHAATYRATSSLSSLTTRPAVGGKGEAKGGLEVRLQSGEFFRRP
jgi:hypothetical protein